MTDQAISPLRRRMAPPAIAVAWFDIALATPVLPIATGQPGSSYP